MYGQDAKYSRKNNWRDRISPSTLDRVASTTSPGASAWPATRANSATDSNVRACRPIVRSRRCHVVARSGRRRPIEWLQPQRSSAICTIDARLRLSGERATRHEIVSEPSPCLGACTRPWPCGVTMYRKILDISHSSCVT